MNNFLINTKTLTKKQWVFDAAFAFAVFLFGIAQVLLTSTSIMVHDESFRDMVGYVNVTPSLSVFIGLAFLSFPLVLRRQFSWPVFIFVLVAFLGLQDAFRGYSLTIAGPMVALFTIASERSRFEAVIAMVIGVIGILTGETSALSVSLAGLIRLQNSTSLVVSALAGYALKTRSEYLCAAEQRAFAAEKSREEEAARRVEEERVRIAREVHDITAHSLSAVSIQAAVAQRMIDEDPEAAKEAILLVRKTAKTALEEIRSMIGVLRRGDAAAEMFPTEGTDRMGDIVEYLQEASLAVVLDDSRFDKAQVPAYIDLALFGIVREAATNIVRHAQATTVTVQLTSTAAGVVLLVEDDGVGRMDDEAVLGHGVRGMEERVRLLGGTFTSYNRAMGGFAIRVEIPLLERDS